MLLFKRQGFQDLDLDLDLGGIGGGPTASSAYMCTHSSQPRARVGEAGLSASGGAALGSFSSEWPGQD
jgi:hypothetical protein